MAIDWAGQLGRKRRARDDAAGQLARSACESTAVATAIARQRWSGIVDAVRQTVAAYNAGADEVLLSVVEDRDSAERPQVRIAARAAGPFLSATLEGTLICVCAGEGEIVSRRAEHRVSADRDDNGTAAYVLQNWLEGL